MVIFFISLASNKNIIDNQSNPNKYMVIFHKTSDERRYPHGDISQPTPQPSRSNLIPHLSDRSAYHLDLPQRIPLQNI